MNTPPTKRAARAIGLLLALTLALSPAVPAQVRLPALGESASDDFNIGTEKRLGEQIMREVRRDPDYLDDPALLEYLLSVWRPLVQAARQRGDIGADVATLFPFEAFLVRDRSVNAFALPGGYVGVHLGLIAMTSTRDELASVLAHELSHLSQRHIARSVTSSQRSSALGLAAMILGVLAASRASSPDAAQAVIAGSQAAMLQAQLNFSRDMEREADRNGHALMALAGFAPGGMVSMFDRLDHANRINDSGAFPYLRSHPLTVDRIGEAQQRSALLAATAPAPAALAQWHALMRARARVLMDPSVDALHRLKDFAPREDGVEEALSGLYAAALAAMRLRDFDRAGRALTDALALPSARPGGPARRALQQLSVQLALERGDAVAAALGLDATAGDASRPALLLQAQYALASGEAAALRQCTGALQTWVAEHRLDATAWQQLSLCADRQGQALRAVRAAAESQAALGNLPGAIDRLRAGQRMARSGGAAVDFIEASVIDSRLRDLQAQRRELIAEQRGPRGRTGSGKPDEED